MLVNRAGAAKFLGQSLPLTAGAQNVNDGREDLPRRHRFSPAARFALIGPTVRPLSNRKECFNGGPKLIRYFPRFYLWHLGNPFLRKSPLEGKLYLRISSYYYVTPVEAAWSPKEKEDWLRAFNYYTGDVVSIHEVYPGHYVQFLCMNASPATKLEKILGSYAFIEGWAHYSEQMLVDEGFGEAGPAAGAQPKALKAAKYRLAQLDESMLRLCRLCVAIKMHCQGMSLADGAKFFHENCYYGEKPAYAEARRGTFDPGYANYTLGKLMILKLRKDYQQQEGTGYSLEKFHKELLRHGTPPVPLLREIMLTDQALWPKAL
jgi:hypothetical protein